jgi:exodeoxyribonuclease-3
MDWLDQTQPDVLGLQETKISGDQLTDQLLHSHGYKTYWSHAEKRGYSGVCILSKEEPLQVIEGLGDPKFDCEGRTLLAEFNDFYFYTIYFPNGQRNEERLQYKLDFYAAYLAHVQHLQQTTGKVVITCGDYNTAHKPIDLARPKENVKISGFLPVEREWMDTYVDAGYIDTFRHVCDEPDRYSWWNVRSGARARNVGWRIDYFFISANGEKYIHGADIHDQVYGSDHCPVSLTLTL